MLECVGLLESAVFCNSFFFLCILDSSLKSQSSRWCQRLLPVLVEAMLDFLTIFSAVGLQQELKKAHGEQSLVIREDDASPSNLVESAAGHLADAMDAFDTAVSESFGAFLGGGQEEPKPAPKKA